MQKSKSKKQIRHQVIRRSERLKASSLTKIVDSPHSKQSFFHRSNRKVQYNDRLMPIVSPTRKYQLAHLNTTPPISEDDDYNRRLSNATGVRSLATALTYSAPSNSPSMHYRPLRDLYKLQPDSYLKLSPKKPAIVRNFTPDRILDAPGLIDDHNSLMIDCSPIGVIAVVLNNVVYLWREENDQTKMILEIKAPDCISCVKFSRNGRKLCVGTKCGRIITHEFDLYGYHEVLSFTSDTVNLQDLHLEFESEDSLWVGSHDGSLLITSVKKYEDRKPMSESLTILTTPHSSPIIRIRSCPEYIAVSEIRGLVSLWRHKTLIRLISHPSPIVDISWSINAPDIIAIAGGKTVNFYSVFRGKITGQINTEHEICCILWSSSTSEIVISTYSPIDHLTLCSYPELRILNSWIGHDHPPTYLGLTSNGTTVISASPDEFLKVICIKLNIVLENFS